MTTLNLDFYGSIELKLEARVQFSQLTLERLGSNENQSMELCWMKNDRALVVSMMNLTQFGQHCCLFSSQPCLKKKKYTDNGTEQYFRCKKCSPEHYFIYKECGTLNRHMVCMSPQVVQQDEGTKQHDCYCSQLLKQRLCPDLERGKWILLFFLGMALQGPPKQLLE